MKLEEFIGQLEGKANHVYVDSAGFPSIGIGHCLTAEELNCDKILIKGEYVDFENGLTDQQIYDLFHQDLHPICVALDVWVKPSLQEYQRIALISFVFNVGLNNFKESTLLEVVNEGRFDQMPFQLRRWNKSWNRQRTKKIVNKILVNRRESEIKMWNGEL